jgi:hypothetical protein
MKVNTAAAKAKENGRLIVQGETKIKVNDCVATRDFHAFFRVVCLCYVGGLKFFSLEKIAVPPRIVGRIAPFSGDELYVLI